MPTETPYRVFHDTTDGRTPSAGRKDFTEEVSQLRVAIVNLSAAFHRSDPLPVSSQLRPLVAGLVRLQDDVAAFRALAEAALANVEPVDAAVRPAAGGTPRKQQVTLRSLSARYSLSVERLKRMNPHLEDVADDTPLPRHTKVTLRESSTPRATTPVRRVPTTAAEHPVAPTPAARTPVQEHAVAKRRESVHREEEALPNTGEDTIRGIAKRHGVRIGELLSVNPASLEKYGLDEPLPPNIELIIPVPADNPRVPDEKAAEPVRDLWTARGDTIATLSFDLQVSVEVLWDYNVSLRRWAKDEPLPEGIRIAVPSRSGDNVRDYASDDGAETDNDALGKSVQVIRLRVPTTLDQVAADHGCTVRDLLRRNPHRGLDALSPSYQLPSGTHLHVPY
jgi:LysM repeat protein